MSLVPEKTCLTVLALLMLPGIVTAASIGTNFGRGADAEIANDQPAIDPVTGQPSTANQVFGDATLGLANSSGVRMQIDPLFLTIIRHRVTVLRFDLSGVEGDLSGAYLEAHSLAQGRTIDIFALNDTAEAGVEDWNESLISYNTAPGFRAVDPLPTNYVALDPSLTTLVGTWSFPGPNSGGGPSTNIAVSAPTPPGGAVPGRLYSDAIATTFGENLSAAAAADTNGLLTLFVIRSGAAAETYGGNNGNVSILTKEGYANDLAAATPVGYRQAPTLVLPNATVIEVGLDGDFNLDGLVDAADYSVWRDGLGSVYTQEDYALWAANYGTVVGPAAIAAPEPGAAALLSLLMLGCGLRRANR